MGEPCIWRSHDHTIYYLDSNRRKTESGRTNDSAATLLCAFKPQHYRQHVPFSPLDVLCYFLT